MTTNFIIKISDLPVSIYLYDKTITLFFNFNKFLFFPEK
jgi:hypothetical protein